MRYVITGYRRSDGGGERWRVNLLRAAQLQHRLYWRQPFGYLDRAGTMESIPKVDDSPCISHHPYGLLSETHVQMVLNALAER